MKKWLIPNAGQFYKANLHCHSNLSDGRLSPEEIRDVYREAGYSVVAFTDHDILLPHPELRSADFLPINGFEVEISQPGLWKQAKSCHICFLALEEDNLTQPMWHRSEYLFANAVKHRNEVRFDPDEPDFIRRYDPACVTAMMRRGREKGFFVTYNHPSWSLEDLRDYGEYHGMHAMEIYNHGCSTDGYPDYNPRVYDDLLRGGERIYAVATDDNHNAAEKGSKKWDSCGGWTMIRAEKLEYRTITRALEAGHFYASSGPEIQSLWFEDGRIHVKSSPAAVVACTKGARSSHSEIAEDGTSLTETSFAVAPDDIYARITVTDAAGCRADTNAYFTDELYRS